MRTRAFILIVEAAGWVVATLVLALVVGDITDSSVPQGVLIPVGVVMALGTLVEIWFPGPLTGKRHPKVPRSADPRHSSSPQNL